MTELSSCYNNRCKWNIRGDNACSKGEISIHDAKNILDKVFNDIAPVASSKLILAYCVDFEEYEE